MVDIHRTGIKTGIFPPFCEKTRRRDNLPSVRRLVGELRQSLSAFVNTFRNANLRRLQIAWAVSEFGDWAASIGLAVYAYQVGGATAVGLVTVVRMVPAAVAAPLASTLGDRFPRRRVMVASDLVRALALAAAAGAVATDAPPEIVYVLTAVVSVAATAFRPAQAAILPSLARSPEELTASNVTSSTVESVSAFVGPAVGGIFVAATDPGFAFGATAATFVASALVLGRITGAPTAPSKESTPAMPGRDGGMLRSVLAGFDVVVRERRLRLLVALFSAQTFVAGALNVLVVVLALEMLDLGQPGIGYLNSALGVGGLLGAVAAMALVGRRRLSSPFAVGLVLWGAPLAAIGIWTNDVTAVLLLAVVGVANTLVDVAGLTLLQRAVPDDVLARVFGVLETLVLATVALGAVVAPLLIDQLGTRGALIAIGLFLPTLTLLAWRRLAEIDAAAAIPADAVTLLREIPIFAPLPSATLEALAVRLARVSVRAGSVLFQQGDEGDRFYLVADGEIDVKVDGALAAAERRGGYFGEIALLHEVRRTGTATARTDATLWTLGREEFVAAVTGHAKSAEAADAVVAARLASLRPQIASL